MGAYMDIVGIVISPEMVKLIGEIDEFKGAWRALQNLAPDRLIQLRKVATIESVGSSTRIEGVKLTDAEIDRLLSGVGLAPFNSRDEQEVVGYAEAMHLVFESFADIPITENHIKQLHQILLKHVAKDVWHRGEYKKLPNSVEAFDADGTPVGVVFETTSPFATPQKMRELVEWMAGVVAEGRHHPLVVVAIFIIHFLAIHPFQDGSGRLSRILTTLLLLKSGYLYVPYVSLERVIEENKDRYYLALRRAQGTLHTGNARMGDWFLFFLQSLRKQVHALDRKLQCERDLMTLSKLSQDILVAVREHGRVTVRDLQRLTGANRNTIKAHLKRLVRQRQLTQEGQGKGTWYRRCT